MLFLGKISFFNSYTVLVPIYIEHILHIDTVYACIEIDILFSINILNLKIIISIYKLYFQFQAKKQKEHLFV